MSFMLLIGVAVFLSLGMTAAWAAQRVSGNSGWVDALWSALVGLSAAGALWVMDAPVDERRWVALALVIVWSVRLASHIAGRSHGAAEDPRYADLMEQWGDKAALNLFVFLQIQALAAFGLVVSVIAAAASPAPFGLFDVAAIVVAVIAIAGEAVADAQLRAHSKANAGQKTICERGLWAWSRHPNYFFEWLFWCAWVVMAMSALTTGDWVLFGLSLIAPALMYWLLVHASGIPPLEKHMLKSRGEAFRRYQERVSAFFPLPPRIQQPQELKR